MASETRIKHLLIRYNDHMEGVSDTIASHQEIINEKGYVWFGKVGKPLKKDYPDYVRKQKEKGTDIYAVFLKQSKFKFEVWKARIIDITRDDVRRKEKEFVPPYYRNAYYDFGFWAKVDRFTRMNSNVIQKIIVSSSRSVLADSLGSTAGTMFIEIPPDAT